MGSCGGGTKRNTPTKKRKKTKKKKKITLSSSNGVKKKSQPLLLTCHHNNQIAKLIPFLISTANSVYSFLLRHDLHLLPKQSLSLESLLASTSISVSNLFSLLSLPPPLTVPHAANPPDSDCWFQRFLASATSDSDSRWIHFFNLGKPSFTLLLRLLTPSLSSLFPLPPNYALALALLRLAHGASYSAISRRFGLDSATACRAFYAVCKAINEKLGHLFELKTDINRVIVGFGWISLPNCCGVLGLEKFELDGDLMGENGYLIVQALVDSEGRFLDVSAGWPCTMSPVNILRQSKLFSGIEESKGYLNGPTFELNDGNSIPQYILGDSCLPLLPWLLTPYIKPVEDVDLSPTQAAFNSVHARAMELVGTAFERVRCRWKLVANKWKGRCDEAFPFVIVACCLLHNFLIKCSENLPDENVEYSRNQEFPVCDEALDDSGKRVRDVIASHLCLVS
ncbi:protein ALP1-like [Ipomoea triloba]|uniref:protein ALP1-like n=1 Tax=Ipomoea triloba TaxID=35885 RepID=UPI00125E3396|nr:protein ALP1-like [Ipomoea triloba]XP_031106982.1 protein ALP1-like [Ipomoea triloba]